jgi:hypothetical protein
MQIPLIGPSYTERSPDLNAQTCVNLFPVSGGPDGSSVSALYGTPGLKTFTIIGTSAIRGSHVFGKNLFTVSGNTLYRVSAGGVTTSVGTLSSENGPIRFADNGNVFMLVDGARGYLWDGASLELITDNGFPGLDVNGDPVPDEKAPSQVVFLGGYFIFDNPQQPGQFMVSTLYATDPADMVAALDYATAEADPDGLIALAAVGDQLWLLGENTTERWYHSGDVLPFSPVGGGRMDRGCAAARSVARAGESLLWLATDRVGRVQVVASSGGNASPVSTPALEFALSGYPSIDDARAYAYHQDGHLFYVLTLPSGDATWVFDLTTNMWHRRAGWKAPNWTRHRGDTYTFFAGKHLVGDHGSGKLYQIDLNSYTDDGDTIRRERTAPVISANGSRIFFHGLELELETGIANSTTPNPMVALDWSDDGGHSWSHDALADLGAVGEYDTPVRFSRLGSARRRNFRLVITDPVKVAISGATLDAQVGSA